MGIILQNNLKFVNTVTRISMNILGTVKRMLYQISQHQRNRWATHQFAGWYYNVTVRLRTNLRYYEIEIIQNRAKWFIYNITSRGASITVARRKLNL